MITGVWVSPDGEEAAVQHDGGIVERSGSQETDTYWAEVDEIPGDWTRVFPLEDR
jgi:ribosome biogenesis protein Tsr3